MSYYVYVLSGMSDTVLYTGVTNDQIKRVYQHKNNVDPKSFSARYNVHKLVYYETTDDVYTAISREKQIKSWKRAKKTELINSMNPEWKDLYNDIIG